MNGIQERKRPMAKGEETFERTQKKISLGQKRAVNPGRFKLGHTPWNRSRKLGPSPNRKWTPEKETFLRRHFHKMSNVVLEKELGLSDSSIAMKAHQLGLVKSEGFKKSLKQKAGRISNVKRYGTYSKKMDQFLITHKNLSNRELTLMFNERFSTQKNWWSIGKRINQITKRTDKELSEINSKVMNRLRQDFSFREKQLRGLRSPEHRRYRTQIIKETFSDPIVKQKAVRKAIETKRRLGTFEKLKLEIIRRNKDPGITRNVLKGLKNHITTNIFYQGRQEREIWILYFRSEHVLLVR